jgi:gliding motility-associated-like protein
VFHHKFVNFVINQEICIFKSYRLKKPASEHSSNYMSKQNIYRAFLILCLFFSAFYSSGQIQVSGYTACPNQIVTVTATWNNVTANSLTLVIPAGGSGQTNLGNSLTFTISHTGPPNPNTTFTLMGSGSGSSGTTTSSTQFVLTINVPPALSFTNGANNGNYCPGQNANIIAPPGGDYYLVTGPGVGTSVSFPSNIISFGPLISGGPSVYSIVSVGSCTMSGTTTINVAPNNQITVNTTSNVCLGGTVGLTANLLNSVGTYTWLDQYGNEVSNGPSNHTINNIQLTQGGTYTVFSAVAFNGIECPRFATTTVNVVATSPIIVSASPSNYLCQGDKLTLAAGAGASAVSYSWTGPAGFSSPLPGPIINSIAPPNAGVYSVTAYFTNNFTTCTTYTNITISVVPVTPPVIFMPASVCQNANITFSALAGSGATYEWFGPGFSFIGQTASINTVQPSNSGTYYVTAKYGSSATTTCASTSSTQLNVIQVNTVSVIPPTPVCQPDNAHLQANATGAIAYNWVGPNSYSASGANVTIYYPLPSASGVYTVTASFGGGNLICKNTNTVSLTVNPVLNFSLVPRQQGCYNSYMEVKGPSGATTYTWTSSTGYISNSKDIVFNSIQPINAGTYTLNVNLGPCITSASTTIEVLTPISFTLKPQSRTVCRGDTVVMEGGVTGGSENYAYIWNPSVFLDSPTGPLKKIVPTGSVIYNLIAHDIACPNFTLSHSFSVNVNQPPQPVMELPRTNGCTPFTMVLDPGTGDDAAITTFDFGGSKQYQPDTIPFKLTINEPGTYTLRVLSKGKNGCSGTYEFPYPIEVRPGPGSDIYWSPEKPTTTDEITFYASYKSDPITYFNWSFSGGIPSDSAAAVDPPSADTSNAKNPTRKYENYGKYPVMLISRNEYECTDTVVKFMDVIDDMNIYIPNSFTPNGDGINDMFFVKGMGLKSEGFTMELCDRSGSTFFKTKDITEAWDGKINGQIAMGGVYVYKIRVVGMNGEGRKEYVGYFTLIR